MTGDYDLVDATVFSGNYTHNKCSLDCYIETIVTYCSCGFWATRPGLSYKPCTMDDLSCINDLWYGITE